jgi:rhodanese-related sulfurtransferase
MKRLSVAQLSQWLTDPERERPKLLDVREPWEFAICRIQGSELIPLGTLASRLQTIDCARPVICVCHHGTRSFQAALALEQRGCGDVYNLTGGIDAWARQIDPAMPIY